MQIPEMKKEGINALLGIEVNQKKTELTLKDDNHAKGRGRANCVADGMVKEASAM